MNLLQDRLVGLSLEDVLNKIEAPGHAISREVRPLLDAYLASMGATEEDLGQLAPLFLRWLDISGTMDPITPGPHEEAKISADTPSRIDLASSVSALF